MRRRKLLSVLLALAAAVSMTACGGSKKPQETTQAAAETTAAAQTEAATEPETEPAPPYNPYEYTYGAITIGVPLDLPEEPADNGKSVTFSDPEGLWTVTFTPLEYQAFQNTRNNTGVSVGWCEDFGFYQNVISGEDRSAEIADGKYNVTFFGVERNPDWVEASMGYSTFRKEAAAWYYVDYGDSIVGPWGGLEISISAPEETKDPLAGIMEDEDVQTLIRNISFHEGSAEAVISIPGIAVHYPARWKAGTDNATTIWLPITGDTSGTIFFTASTGPDPLFTAGTISENPVTVNYNGRDWVGEVRTSKIDDKVLRQLELYTEFTEYHALGMKLSLQKAEDDKAFWDYAKSDRFTEIMNALELDPDAYHDPEEDRMDKSGFQCDNINQISAYTGSDTEIVIPAVIGTNTIVGINTNVFKGNTSLKKVTVSEGISYIGYSSFEGCTSLEEVVLPNSLSYIDMHAFEGCTALKSVTFGEGLTEIDNEAFEGCAALTDVTLGSGVQRIGSSAFNGAGSGEGSFVCEADGTVYDGTALCGAKFRTVTIGTNADLSASSIMQDLTAESVVIGYGATALGRSFMDAWDDETLTSVTLPSSIESIGEYAFKGRHGLKAINIEAVQTLGNSAFSGTGLVNIVIPGTLKEIPDYAFQACPDVMSITIEEGVETIGASAFDSCGRHYPDRWNYLFTDQWEQKLADTPNAVPNGTDPFDRAVDLYLPSSIKSVGERAFSSVFLQGVYMLSVTEPSLMPEIHPQAFYDATVKQVYFTEETIGQYGDDMDAIVSSWEDVGEVAWYDKGSRIIWSEEPIPVN